jgi:hypothetical protein
MSHIDPHEPKHHTSRLLCLPIACHTFILTARAMKQLTYMSPNPSALHLHTTHADCCCSPINRAAHIATCSRHTHTPMPDQNGFMPFDGEGKLVPTNLWSLALAGLPVRHAVYLRGTNLQPPGKFKLPSSVSAVHQVGVSSVFLLDYSVHVYEVMCFSTKVAVTPTQGTRVQLSFHDFSLQSHACCGV